MNLNLAEKIGVFVGATTLSFALGIAACSPLAPSVEKSKLTNNRPGTADPGSTPAPTPNGLHMLFFRDQSGANILVGNDAFTWFFKSQPKNVKQILVSSESLPGTLSDFKSGGDVDVPVIPSTDWQPAADGTFSGTIAFQLNLVENSLTPAQVEAFDYDLVPPAADDVNRAITGHTAVNWKVKIKPTVPQDTKTVFLNALDAIRLSINCKDEPISASSPGPTPNQD